MPMRGKNSNFAAGKQRKVKRRDVVTIGISLGDAAGILRLV